MKILVTGSNGQLGFDIVKMLRENKYMNIYNFGRSEMDITDFKKMKKIIIDIYPDIIIHCAAYTKVDDAEENRAICEKVNVEGTKNLVKISKIINSKFIYISTDYVFNGNKNAKYKEDDYCSPKSIYGTTKYLGELESKKIKKHFIVRVSWLFGKNGNNFVKKIIDLSKNQKVIRVVSDQIGSPTYTLDVSKKIIEIMTSNMYGTYHITNEGSCSWYVFAKFILKYIGSETIVEAVKTIDFPQKASRPLNSVLSNEKLIKSGFGNMPTWEDALKRFLTEIGELK